LLRHAAGATLPRPPREGRCVTRNKRAKSFAETMYDAIRLCSCQRAWGADAITVKGVDLVRS
jgi:hypothetical protein